MTVEKKTNGEELNELQEATDAQVEEDAKAVQEDIADMIGVQDEESEEVPVEEETEEETAESVEGEEGEETEAGEEEIDEIEEASEEESEENLEVEETEESEEPESPEPSAIQAEIDRLLTLKEEQGEEKPGEEKPVEEENELQKFVNTPQEEVVDYFVDDALDGVFDDTEKASLNKIINHAVETAYNRGRLQSIKDNMEVFPSMIDYKIEGHAAAREFWTNNQDLKEAITKNPRVGKYITGRATEIQKDNPKMNAKEVYTSLEKEARELFKGILPQKGSTDSSKKRKKPALAKKPGSGRKGPGKSGDGLSKEQKEINELMELNN